MAKIAWRRVAGGAREGNPRKQRRGLPAHLWSAMQAEVGFSTTAGPRRPACPRARVTRPLLVASSLLGASTWGAYQLGATLSAPSPEAYARAARQAATAGGWSSDSAVSVLEKLEAGEELWPEAPVLAAERHALADRYWRSDSPGAERDRGESRRLAQIVLLFDPDHPQASSVFEERRE